MNARGAARHERMDLRDHILTARRELFGLRFQHATGELDNTARLDAPSARWLGR